jgi:hypothetical protein
MKYGPREIRELLRGMDPPVVFIGIAPIGPKNLKAKDVAKFNYKKFKHISTIKAWEAM